MKQIFTLALFIVFHTSIFAQWNKIESIPRNIAGVYFLQHQDTTLIYFEGKLFKNSDKNETWKRCKFNAPKDVRSIIMHNNKLLVGTNGLSGEGMLFESKDLGKTWTKYEDQLKHGKLVTCLCANNSSILIGTKYGLFQAENPQKQWKRITLNSKPKAYVHRIASYEKRVLVKTDKLYHSCDNGKTWKMYNQGLPENYHLGALSVNESVSYASIGNSFKPSPETDGIYIRYHGDSKWTKLLNNESFWAFDLKLDCCDHLFFSTWHGIFAYINGRTHNLSGDLPKNDTNKDLATLIGSFHIWKNRIYVGLNGVGVYYCDLSYNVKLE